MTSDTSETAVLPTIVVRGRSFMALVLAPEPPLAPWFEALDRQMAQSAGFFTDRPVIANLVAVVEEDGALNAVLDGFEARQLRVISVEGVEAEALAETRWAKLPNLVRGRDIRRVDEDKAVAVPTAQAPEPEPEPVAPSLIVDRPVRSGQSVIFEDGDLIIVGGVASGADVIAGGSIHVYGALRGRAIAGLKTGAAARIFARNFAAEMVAVDGIYRAAEQCGEEVRGRAVQIRLEGAVLKFDRLD